MMDWLREFKWLVSKKNRWGRPSENLIRAANN